MGYCGWNGHFLFSLYFTPIVTPGTHLLPGGQTGNLERGTSLSWTDNLHHGRNVCKHHIDSLVYCHKHIFSHLKLIAISWMKIMQMCWLSFSKALDEEYLKVDAQFGGVDQRKIFTYAEKVWGIFHVSLFEAVGVTQYSQRFILLKKT